MSLKLDPNINYLLEVDSEQNSNIEIYAAAEKEWLKTNPNDNTDRFVRIVKVLGTALYQTNADSLHGGEKINTDTKQKPQSLWYTRLDNLKRSSDMSKPLPKRTPFKTNLFRFAYIVCLVIAALSLLFPPFTNLLRDNTALIAEIIIIFLGVASLFAGAIAITILAVFVLILVEESLWWIIPSLSPFWQNWFAPGFIIVVCLIAAAVFFVNYYNEKAFLENYLTFKNEHLIKQIDRVKRYRSRLEKLIDTAEQAKDVCLKDFIDNNDPSEYTEDDLMAAGLPAFLLHDYYTHCLKDFDSYLSYLETYL